MVYGFGVWGSVALLALGLRIQSFGMELRV